jgi:hypothetical protein
LPSISRKYFTVPTLSSSVASSSHTMRAWLTFGQPGAIAGS